MAIASPRNAYADVARSTASPGRLLTMLYDRLYRDLAEAEQAMSARDFSKANMALVHAQDIVEALRTALDHKVWAGAANLDQIYSFLLTELVSANVRKNPAQVAACRKVIEPLRDAWHQAFASHGDAAVPVGGM